VKEEGNRKKRDSVERVKEKKKIRRKGGELEERKSFCSSVSSLCGTFLLTPQCLVRIMRCHGYRTSGKPSFEPGTTPPHLTLRL
jgi:hypothetical protein